MVAAMKVDTEASECDPLGVDTKTRTLFIAHRMPSPKEDLNRLDPPRKGG